MEVHAERETEIDIAREVEERLCEKMLVCLSETSDENHEHHRTERIALVEVTEDCSKRMIAY
jgi:hypothetical protein